MSLLDPLTHALAALLAGSHLLLGGSWILAIGALVVVVRTALLPFVVHSVRQAHAAARARPHLQELARGLRGVDRRRDPEAVARYLAERRAIAAEHKLSRLGCLPLLLQLPVWWALYHLVSGVAAGATVGAMDAGLVASLAGATLLGVPLAGRGYLGAGLAHVAVVASLALTAATLAYVTQRFLVAPNTATDGLPEAVVSAQQLMPAVSAVGLLVVGGFVPVALLVYWVANNAWTLGQTAVVRRWWPTPGT